MVLPVCPPLALMLLIANKPFFFFPLPSMRRFPLIASGMLRFCPFSFPRSKTPSLRFFFFVDKCRLLMWKSQPSPPPPPPSLTPGTRIFPSPWEPSGLSGPRPCPLHQQNKRKFSPNQSLPWLHICDEPLYEFSPGENIFTILMGSPLPGQF